LADCRRIIVCQWSPPYATTPIDIILDQKYSLVHTSLTQAVDAATTDACLGKRKYLRNYQLWNMGQWDATLFYMK
jgi:hypothetical protein